jgi:pectate lyase
VFAVSGTIHLQSKLLIRGNATIAGQTAPGDGICLADQPVVLNGDNIIVRYLRFRMGDRYQQSGKVHGSGSDDAFGASKRKHIIIDHCSMSWSTDEVCSVYGGDSTTLQWNIIAEPLNYSYHFETGDTDFENHGFGGIWGGSHLSAHHNLFAHCLSRNPRFNGARLGASDELVDFTNNVIYNWGNNSTYGGENGRYNMVNNFYKYGPSTTPSVRFRIVNPSADATGKTGQFFVQGNVVDGAPDVSRNNESGIHIDKKAADDQKQKTIARTPFAVDPTTVQSAEAAFEAVLKGAGASYRRDTLDQRIMKDVRNRTGRIIDVQGGFPHGTAYEQTVKAWPALQAAPALADSDKDGMPDEWERKNGLNPDVNDAAGNKLHQHYTNIEVYINSLLK